MPFDRNGLRSLGSGVWVYRTDEDTTAVNAPGYWTPAWPLLRVGDAIFRTTLDSNGQVTSQGRHVITAAGRAAVTSANGFGGGSIVTPPPGDTQLTGTAWLLDFDLIATAGGLANNEITYTTGLLDFRADNDLLVTTANGAVSTLTSGQSLAGTLTQATAANQPAHSSAADTITFTSASATDEAAGDWLSLPSIATRYQTGSNVAGIFYLLIRVPVLPMARTATLIRVGANSGVYTREYGRSHALILGSTGGLNIIREGDTSGTYQQVNFGGGGLMNANVWTAVAWTLNRTGGSTSFLHAKAKSGNLATMQQVSTTAATSVTADASTIANVNRNRWGGNASSNNFGTGWELHSVGFDAAPPTTDTVIEGNLDKLLARV